MRPLFFIAVLLFVAGCGKDDDPKASSQIVGTWSVQTTDTDITAPGDDLHKYLMDEVGMNSSEADSYVVYLESGEAGKLDVKSLVFDNNGSYSAIGETGAKFAGTWEITAGNIVVIFDKGSTSEQVVSIESLSDTELKLRFDLSKQISIANLKYELVLSFGKN